MEDYGVADKDSLMKELKRQRPPHGKTWNLVLKTTVIDFEVKERDVIKCGCKNKSTLMWTFSSSGLSVCFSVWDKGSELLSCSSYNERLECCILNYICCSMSKQMVFRLNLGFF